MGIQGHRRRSRWPIDVTEDSRLPTFANDLDVEPFGPQQGGDLLGAGVEVCLVEPLQGVQRDTGDPREVLQVGAQGGEQVADAGADGLDVDGGQVLIGHPPEPTDANVGALPPTPRALRPGPLRRWDSAPTRPPRSCRRR